MLAGLPQRLHFGCFEHFVVSPDWSATARRIQAESTAHGIHGTHGNRIKRKDAKTLRSE